MKLHLKRTAEPQNIEYRILLRRTSVEGWNRFAQSYYKIGRSTKKLTTGRIHSFDTCPPQEDSTFIIRYSIFAFSKAWRRLNPTYKTRARPRSFWDAFSIEDEYEYDDEDDSNTLFGINIDVVSYEQQPLAKKRPV